MRDLELFLFGTVFGLILAFVLDKVAFPAIFWVDRQLESSARARGGRTSR